MKDRGDASAFVSYGGEISLDGEGCVGLIKATLAKKANLRFRVRGFSMSPLIRDGDVVTLAPLPETAIEPGRVIAFLRSCDGKMIIHRLVKIYRGSDARYVPKGDNVCRTDDPVLRSGILGGVAKVERDGRSVFFGCGPGRTWIALLNRVNFFCVLCFFWRWVPLPLRHKVRRWI